MNKLSAENVNEHLKPFSSVSFLQPAVLTANDKLQEINGAAWRTL